MSLKENHPLVIYNILYSYSVSTDQTPFSDALQGELQHHSTVGTDKLTS